MASAGNQHCASCIGTLSFPIENSCTTICFMARQANSHTDSDTDAVISRRLVCIYHVQL